MSENASGDNRVIEVEGLSYSYKKRRALRDVTFSVELGAIHGFVGPNGAGKTTTLKVLATLLKPRWGRVRVFGRDVIREYKKVRQRLGFMPDFLGMYRQMTVFEYLDFFAAAYGLGVRERNKVIDDVLTLTDMQERKDDFIKGLSRGMQQRVGLARLLVNDPELLLLDEPAAGLDPRARIELMEILKELCRLGKTIFISSHILAELADLCDSVTIIDRGVIKYCGSMKGLAYRDEKVSDYIVTLADEHPAAEEMLRGIPGVTQAARVEGEEAYKFSFDTAKTDVNSVLQAVMQSGARIASLKEDTRPLSQAFMDLTEPGVPT